VLKIILEPKGNKSQEERERFMAKNLGHFYFSSVEEGEMSGSLSTIGWDGKYIQTFSRKSWKEENTWTNWT